MRSPGFRGGSKSRAGPRPEKIRATASPWETPYPPSSTSARGIPAASWTIWVRMARSCGYISMLPSGSSDRRSCPAEMTAAPGLNRSIAGTPPYLYTYVACTGNDWGRSVIKKVNTVLDRERAKKSYQQFSERWYPQEDRKKVRRYYPHMLKE